ncbi:MAG: hypothetical protein V3U20_00190, partial [Thermoplasmata archaeon]
MDNNSLGNLIKKKNVCHGRVMSMLVVGMLLTAAFASMLTSIPTSADVTEHDVSAGVADVFVADVNMDGYNDIITTTYSWWGPPGVSVLWNDGSGDFPTSGTPDYGDDLRNDYYFVFIGGNPECLFVEDVDGINGPDILITFPDDNILLVLHNNGTGFFDDDLDQWNGLNATLYFTSNRPLGIFVKDLDGDNWNDAVITNRDDNTVSILRNDGLGRIFDDDLDPFNGNGVNQVDCTVANGPRRVFVEDVDGMNGPDILVANEDWGNGLTILLNDGTGNFQTSGTQEYDGDGRDDYNTYSGSNDIFIGDIDGDLDNDTVLAGSERSIKVLLNDGTGFFDDDHERNNENL